MASKIIISESVHIECMRRGCGDLFACKKGEARTGDCKNGKMCYDLNSNTHADKGSLGARNFW